MGATSDRAKAYAQKLAKEFGAAACRQDVIGKVEQATTGSPSLLGRLFGRTKGSRLLL